MPKNNKPKNNSSALSGLLSVVLIFSFGCAGIESSRDNSRAGSNRGQTNRGQINQGQSNQGFDGDTQMLNSDDQNKQQKTKRKIALVLGPGAYKTFAYPGFIKSFVQAGVKPDLVIGLEWGALSAAAFALNGKSHEAEWKLFKLQKEQVEDTGLFGGQKPIKTNKLRDFLKENMGLKSEAETVIPFRCPLLRLDKGSVDWSSSGPLWRRVESCLASPPRLEPSVDMGPSVMAPAEIAKNLKREGYGIIILVNVLGGSGPLLPSSEPWLSRAYWAEVRRQLWADSQEFTDLVQIDTRSFSLFDFRAKTGLQAEGEKVGREAAQALVKKYEL